VRSAALLYAGLQHPAILADSVRQQAPAPDAT
jgi:hypothetical protein